MKCIIVTNYINHKLHLLLLTERIFSQYDNIWSVWTDLLAHRTGLPGLDPGLMAGYPASISRAELTK